MGGVASHASARDDDRPSPHVLTGGLCMTLMSTSTMVPNLEKMSISSCLFTSWGRFPGKGAPEGLGKNPADATPNSRR